MGACGRFMSKPSARISANETNYHTTARTRTFTSHSQRRNLTANLCSWPAVSGKVTQRGKEFGISSTSSRSLLELGRVTLQVPKPKRSK